MNEYGTVAYYDFIIAALSYSNVVFDGWIHGGHIMKFTLNQFIDDECNRLINLAWSGFRKASFRIRSVMHPDTMASKLTSYAMKYGYDETNAYNTLAYTRNHDAYIYRHLNDCMSDTVMISMQSWDSL